MEKFSLTSTLLAPKDDRMANRCSVEKLLVLDMVDGSAIVVLIQVSESLINYQTRLVLGYLCIVYPFSYSYLSQSVIHSTIHSFILIFQLTCIYGDHSLYVWDVHDVYKIGKQWSFLYHSSYIWGIDVYPEVTDGNKVSLPPNTFSTCSSDNTVRIWNIDPLMDTTIFSKNIYSPVSSLIF